MADEPHEPPPPLAREFIVALTTLAGEVRGLREDLAAVYGRDAAGRLLARPPANGAPAPMPAPAWTPRDVKDLASQIFGPPPRKRRR